MKGRRHTPEQIVRKLREAHRLLAEGSHVDSNCRYLEISMQTYQRWRSQSKPMRLEYVLRLEQLEKANGGLRRLLAEKISTTTWSGGPRTPPACELRPQVIATRGDPHGNPAV